MEYKMIEQNIYVSYNETHNTKETVEHYYVSVLSLITAVLCICIIIYLCVDKCYLSKRKPKQASTGHVEMSDTDMFTNPGSLMHTDAV